MRTATVPGPAALASTEHRQRGPEQGAVSDRMFVALRGALGLGAVLLMLGGCKPAAATTTNPTSTSDETESTTTGSEPADANAADDDECVSLVEATVADEAYARGIEGLERARDGEHLLAEPYEEAMGSLRVAAEQGHRGAQSLYGRTSFSTMFMARAPEDGDRDDYIAALAFIRIAGKRGDPEADGFLPGLTETPLATEPPFDALPPKWIEQAVEQADTWLECHGEAAKDRGV